MIAGPVVLLAVLLAGAPLPLTLPKASNTVSLAVLTAAPADLEPLLRRYARDAASVDGFYRLMFCEAAQRRRTTFAQEWLGQLDRIDFGRLSSTARVDYLLLRGHLLHQIARLEFERRREREMLPRIPFAPEIAALEEARREMAAVDPEQAATQLGRLADAVKAARADKAPLAPALALRTANALGELRATLAVWFGHYDGFKPLFSWWCRAPYEAVKKELEEYEKHLREEIAGVRGKDDDPLVGDPIGRDALMADLAYERIPYAPEELVKIAERELAWCEAEMKRAAREMGCGDDWKAALEKVKADHVPPGEQDALVAKQARDAIGFVEKRDLVTIEPLCRETWRVDMLDKDTQRVLPFAAYGGQKMLVAYPLEAMDDATKRMSLRGNNVHFTRIVTPHELIPGHHLQLYMAERYRDYRQFASTPFLVEGWALYWEMLLWDLGYAESPQNRIGMLFWRMHRCARIIVSLSFHLGAMTPPQMIDFLVDRVGHERFTATSEVRRFIGGSYSPLYQCAYMIGGLQLRALYAEAVQKRKWSPKRFHDAVLHEGAIPIDLMRSALRGEAPSKDPAFWRFDPLLQATMR